MDPSVFIDGTPATELGPAKSLAFSRTYAGGQGGGFRDARLTLDLEPGFQHPSLRLAAPVEVRHGAQILGLGTVVSIDRNTWEIVIDGIVRKGENYESRTTAGVPSGLATGLPAAVTRGLPWKIDPALVLPGDVVGQQMQSVTDALNDFAAQQQKSWLIDVDTLRIASDPTTPTLQLLATDNPNSSTDGLVSVVTAKYAAAVDESGNPALISYVSVSLDGAPEHVERTIDLTSNGAMTAADATAQAKAALTSGATSPLTESVQVSPGTLFTADGLDLTDLECTVREGQMVRQLDWINPDGSAGMYRDWIIGEVAWSSDGGLVLTPVGANPATVVGSIIDLRQGVDSAKNTAGTALALGTPDYLQSLITEDSDTTSGSTMPSSAQLGDLWLNNPDAYICTTAYASGGTIANWTKVTDPRTLALMRTHAIAFLAADAAATDATTALTAANGKNKITGATNTPTSSDPGVEGDTWEYFVGGNISAVYTYTSGVWTIRKIRDEVIDTLTVGKITGLDATFLDAHIDYLTSVDITSGTLTGTTLSSGTGQHVEIVSDEIHLYSGAGSEITYGSVGTVAYGGGARADLYLIPPHMSSGSTTSGLALSDDGHGKFTGTDFSISGTLLVPNSPTTTTSNAANAFISTPSGAVFRISGSSRAIKYDIEPADIDDDIAALERCGVFAYHYRTDPTARLIIGVIVEDMMEQGLRRYVDFDENDEPLQPSWNQISALLIAAHQRNARRLSSLEARLDALEAS